MRRLIQRIGSLPYLIFGAGLAYVGLSALNYLVDNVWPFDVERLDLVRAVALDRTDAPALLEAAYTEVIFAFLAAIGATVMGVALPLVYYLNKRFSPTNFRFVVIVRQSAWLGVWAAFCVWLQMNRALSAAVALLILTVFVLFELLLYVRARTANLPARSARSRAAESK